MDIAAAVKDLKNKYEGWEIERSFDTGINQKERISDIDCDRDGNIYLTTMRDNTIHIFSPGGKVIREIREADGKEFNGAEYIRLNRKENILYVSDTMNNRVVSFSPDKGEVNNIYRFEENESQKSVVQAVGIDEKDNLWAVLKFDDFIQICRLDKKLRLENTLVLENMKAVRINSIRVRQGLIYCLLNSFRLDKKITLYKISPGTPVKIETLFQDSDRLLYFFTVDGDHFYVSNASTGLFSSDFLKITLNGDLVYEYKTKKINVPSGLCFYKDRLYIAGMNDGNIRILKRKK